MPATHFPFTLAKALSHILQLVFTGPPPPPLPEPSSCSPRHSGWTQMTLQRLSAISVLTVKSPEHLVKVFQPSSAPRGNKRGLGRTFTRSGSSPKPVPTGLSHVGCLRTGGQKADKGRNTRSCMACALRPPTHTASQGKPQFSFFFFSPLSNFCSSAQSKGMLPQPPILLSRQGTSGTGTKKCKVRSKMMGGRMSTDI